MKKIVGISLVAMFAVMPLFARADISAITPVTLDTTDDLSTTSYVQGAYNDLAGRINTNIGAINVLNGAAGQAGSVAYQVAAEQARASGVESGLNTRLTTAEGAITTLNSGAGVTGSVDYKINAAITEVNSAAGTLGGRVTANENDIADIKQKSISVVKTWNGSAELIPISEFADLNGETQTTP